MIIIPPWVYLIVAIVLEVIGTLCLRFTDGFRNWLPTLFVAIAYAGTFYCMSIVIKTMPTGIVYAIWSGMGMVLIAMIGWAVFNEKLDVPALAGIGLIVIGVLVINLFSRSVAH